MPILLLLFIGTGIATLFQIWILALAFFGFLLFALFLVWGNGGFQKCPKCGWYLTTQESCLTPDASYGWRNPHEQVKQHCWNPKCREVTILSGIVVRFLDSGKPQDK